MSSMNPTRAKQIESTLRSVLNIAYCEISNTSENHKGHSAFSEESHFEIIIVSPDFNGLTKISRHRMVLGMLREQFELGLHSLSMKLWTEDEYNSQ